MEFDALGVVYKEISDGADYKGFRVAYLGYDGFPRTERQTLEDGERRFMMSLNLECGLTKFAATATQVAPGRNTTYGLANIGWGLRLTELYTRQP